jgi:hypothetical protein
MSAPAPRPASQAQSLASARARQRATADVLRVLDWTNIDTTPSATDIARLGALNGNEGRARIAILVNTPKMLRAATAFAEHAGLKGAQVRVFIDSQEATGWLYKDIPEDSRALEWSAKRD